MDTRSKTLLRHAIVLIAVMGGAVPRITGWLGGVRGYFASIAFYWLIFCLPVFFLHTRHGAFTALYSPRLPPGTWWVLPALGLQLGAILMFGVRPHLSRLTAGSLAIALLMGLVNGPLEEAAWRGGFLVRFARQPGRGFWLNWALFTLLHVPLTLAHGITVEGGPLALVGGASGLGLLWSAVAWRTGSVFWTTVAHVLTNTFAFWPLVESNPWH